MNNVDEQLRAIKEERIRRLECELMWFYQANHMQEAMHRCPALIRGMFSGNQGGKSLAGCMEMAWTVGKVHPYRPNLTGRVYGRDCGEDFTVMESVLLTHYENILPRNPCTLDGTTYEGNPRKWPGLKGYSWETAYDRVKHVVSLADGSFIELKTYEQGYRKMQGPTRHIIRLDEEPDDERIFNESIARFMTTEINLIITATPLHYSRWLYTRIFQAAAHDPNIEVFKMSCYDNPYANPNVIRAIEEADMDPAEKTARLFGDFTYLSGRVWKEYGPHNEVEHFIPPDQWKRTIVIDPHPGKPTCVLWFADDSDDRTYVYRERFIEGHVDLVCDEIKTESAHEYVDRILIDRKMAEQCDSQLGKKGRKPDTYFTMFRKNFPTLIKANPNKNARLERVRAALVNKPGGPGLLIMSSCPVTRFQMQNYSYKRPSRTGEERSKPETIRRDDDTCDCVGYKMMDKPVYRKMSAQSIDFRTAVYGNA